METNPQEHSFANPTPRGTNWVANKDSRGRLIFCTLLPFGERQLHSCSHRAGPAVCGSQLVQAGGQDIESNCRSQHWRSAVSNVRWCICTQTSYHEWSHYWLLTGRELSPVKVTSKTTFVICPPSVPQEASHASNWVRMDGEHLTASLSVQQARNHKHHP